MTILKFGIPEKPDEVGYFALAIKMITSKQAHCGMLFQHSDTAINMLHLAWHFDLRMQPQNADYAWITPLYLPETTRKILAVACSRIGTRKPSVPYGLAPGEISFDPDSGNVILGQNGKGLTCTTFITTLFKAYGIEIFKENEWPELANIEWQGNIIDNLEEYGASPDYLAALKNDVGSKRFRPEELVGSSYTDDWPVGFAKATAAARVVLSELS